MNKILLILVVCLFTLMSCKNEQKKRIDDNSARIDTANIEQLEQELKELEEQSSQVNQKIDSIDNLLNE